MDDPTLLRRYAGQRDEEAFATLVRRHLNLVYFTALRHTHGDAHRAEDIAQAVFSALARKAAALAGHASLPGWLFTATRFAARQARRAETRRLRREQEPQAMNEILPESARDAVWEKVRPVIDAALGDLNPQDREAVLLRFFENRPYAEVGAALRLPENSARMRVGRALEKLRLALARRGVTSTGGALAAALTVPATLATPAGLASQIATAAGTAAGTAGAGLALASLFKLMTSAQIIALSAGAAAFLATGIAVRQHHQLSKARAGLIALENRETHLRKLVQDLEWRLAATREREAKAIAARHESAAAPATSATANPLAAPAEPVTHDLVETRHARARALVQQGRYADALPEFLWCFDTGMRQVEGYFLPRYAEVLVEIADLGKKYPPALEALRRRRDAAEARLQLSGTDMATGKDVNQINHVLGEDERTFALFDSFNEDDPRRIHLVDSSINRLIEARRYRELAKVMDYAGIPQWWEAMAGVARSPAPTDDLYRQRMRAIIEAGAAQIETRAGAEELVNASDLIERVLVVDNSPETVAAIKRHLARAGHPELFNP